MKWLIGIDEAGRGPLAGPVAVGVVRVSPDFDWDQIPGVNDSKLLDEAKREAVYTLATDIKKAGDLHWSVAMVGPSSIDKKGIVPAIDLALRRALNKTIKGIEEEIAVIGEIRLDGGLKAPSKFLNQKTIIKGDQKEKVIGLASILAKVTRDRYLIKLSQQSQYSVYEFAKHKGYGTKKHRDIIKTYGLSDIHRLSFCRRLGK